MKIISETHRLRLTIAVVILCITGALPMACGPKDVSAGVAQLDDNNPIIANVDNSENVPESETEIENLPESTLSTEDISDQTDEEIATSFAECLRTEGINVSDPELNADGTVDLAAFRQNMANDPNFNFQDPKTRQTMEKCVPLLQDASFAGQRSGEDEIELQDNLLDFAECLRGIGIDVDDPDFSEGRGGAFRSMIGDLVIDQNSLQAAMSQCSEIIFGNDGNRGPARAGGGRGRPPGR